MKVLLYSEAIGLIKKSGIGKTLSHQIRAMKKNGIAYTLDPKEDYDIVHINTVGPKSYLLAKKAKKNGKKVVIHAHSTEEDFRNSFVLSNQIAPYFKRWLIRCYSLGDVIVTPTLYSKSILERYGIKKKIYAVSNGVELQSDTKEEKEEKANAFRAQFSLSPEQKVVIGVGLYIERKGITDFVELARQLPEYQFIWFGQTPLMLVPKKIRKAVMSNLPNLYFPGYVESDILRGAYYGSDLFLFPTYEETEGIVVLEALAAKQNILLRDIPVYSDWLTDKQEVYKAKTLEEFQELIPLIVEEKLPSLKENGYRVLEERTLEETGRKLVEIYESLLLGP